jgi:hypothetical protein
MVKRKSPMMFSKQIVEDDQLPGLLIDLVELKKIPATSATN